MAAQQNNSLKNNQLAVNQDDFPNRRISDNFSSSRSYAPEYHAQNAYANQRRLCEQLREETRRERTKVSVVCKDLIRYITDHQANDTLVVGFQSPKDNPFHHSPQMNSTTATKRLRYSLISTNRSSTSPILHPLTVKSQSTILAEKYLFLLQIIRDMRCDIRRSYAGSRTSMENLRKRIIKARTIVLQCKDLCTRREYDHCQVLMKHQQTLLPSEYRPKC